MENSGGGGAVQVPPGYRFRPTDQELLHYYLKPKVYSLPFPSHVIPDQYHALQSDPSHLPGDSNERRYFFCKRRWNNVSRCRFATSDGCGYWKAIGKDKCINLAPGSDPIGIKKSFVFYQGNRPRSLKTRWFMREYRLLPSQTTANSSQELEDWVACCIYQRERIAKNHGMNRWRRNVEEVIKGNSDNVMIDVMIFDSTEFDLPPLPSPSCSSGILNNNVSFSNELLLDQEECSSNTFNP